jgi:hypothetical protein
MAELRAVDDGTLNILLSKPNIPFVSEHSALTKLTPGHLLSKRRG